MKPATRKHESSTYQSWLHTNTLPESESLYDWRFTANQLVLAPTPWDTRPVIFFSTEHLRSKSLCNILSDQRMGLSFTIVAGPLHHSHSQVRVPLDSWPYFTVSDSRLPQPGEPGPRIYIPQEQGGPVIPPGTGFHFRRLLRLSGLRWRYWNRLHTGYDRLRIILVGKLSAQTSA
jgi:hypothetical protein